MKRLKQALAILFLAFFIAPLTGNAETFGNSPVNILKSQGVALHGYDPVSYFSSDGPMAGTEAFVVDHEGVSWHFANAANRQEFMRSPHLYVPMYGGYCATGAAAGYKSDIDPKIWLLHNERLYLFSSEKARERWKKDRVAMEKRADHAWRNLKDRPML